MSCMSFLWTLSVERLELGLSWQPESLNALHAKSSHWFIFDMSSGVKHGNDVQVIFDLEQT